MVQEKDWAIVLHGGAKNIEPDQEEANRAGCAAAIAAGSAVLRAGGSALDAVEATIRRLEDDPTFNAGYGSALNADGAVEMDAALMDGTTFDVGAVAVATGVRNPIAVARLLLREQPVLLAGDAVRRFAEAHGAALCAREAMISPEHARGLAASRHDTVGCVALDRAGHLAAGTSTGGLPGTLPGRVGDSPLPGCGLYADDMLGAVSLSGDGESIIRLTLAARIMQALEGLPPALAVERTLARLAIVGGEAGAILIDRQGRIAWHHNSRHFAVAYASSAEETPSVFLRKDEEGKRTHA